MSKGETLRKKDVVARKSTGAEYDELKELLSVARKNGWDLEQLGLIPKDMPKPPTPTLTRKQVVERNRLIKNILRRFAGVLTSPVPAEVEQFIRSKTETEWLPWEREAMERLESWRTEVNRIRPDLLDELKTVFLKGE
jgi:hypothetical protein